MRWTIQGFMRVSLQVVKFLLTALGVATFTRPILESSSLSASTEENYCHGA